MFRHFESDNMNCVWIVHLWDYSAFGIIIHAILSLLSILVTVLRHTNIKLTVFWSEISWSSRGSCPIVLAPSMPKNPTFEGGIHKHHAPNLRFAHDGGTHHCNSWDKLRVFAGFLFITRRPTVTRSTVSQRFQRHVTTVSMSCPVKSNERSKSVGLSPINKILEALAVATQIYKSPTPPSLQQFCNLRFAVGWRRGFSPLKGLLCAA